MEIEVLHSDMYCIDLREKHCHQELYRSMILQLALWHCPIQVCFCDAPDGNASHCQEETGGEPHWMAEQYMG